MAIFEPLNLQYLRRWIRENRPELAEQFQVIVRRADRKDPTGMTMMLMATIGFQSGRLFQEEHPEKGEYEYAVYLTGQMVRSSQHDGVSDPGVQPGQ